MVVPTCGSLLCMAGVAKSGAELLDMSECV
jgi:hypothetical protein